MSEQGVPHDGQRDARTPLPPNETERLEILGRYDILDTPPEETFDEIARLAAAICETPVALIGLVDADRCWFKARVGLSTPEVPRDGSPCARAVLQADDLLVIGDAFGEERGDPALSRLRFYAGAPLVTPEGCALGALLVADAVPRGLDPGQQEALRTLGHQVMCQLEVRRQSRERERAEAGRREAETRYRSIFEHAVEGIFQTTPEGRYRAANPMLARIYGYESPEDLIGHLTDIENQLYVDPERRIEFQRLLAERDAVQGFESQVRRKDGRIIWIRENARALRDDAGRLLGYEGTVEDITERVRAEWALRRASEELEMRVQERTAELARANEALEQAAAERKRFYREVIRSVTRGKFHLVDAAEVSEDGEQILDTPLEVLEDYPKMRALLREVAQAAGMEVPVIRDLVLAAGEAATNAIKHAEHGRCTVWRTEDRLIVRISDQGTGISTENLPASLLQAGFSTKISMGMGYTLMLELVDKVWLATGQGGTIVQMEKWIDPKAHVELPFLSAWAKF